MTSNDCMFCQMADGSFPVDMLHQDGLVFAIRDIAPRAPTHVLIVPRRHFDTARQLDAIEHGSLLGHMLGVANTLADQLGIAESGYRLAVNVGADGGQSIYHLHMHMLGGRQLGAEG